MEGLKIDFTKEGYRLTEEKVEDTAAVAQNILVNMMCEAEKDPVYPLRGTSLRSDALSGSLISEQAAQHIANFAALDTTIFFKSIETPEFPAGFSAIIMEAPLYRALRLMDITMTVVLPEGTTLVAEEVAV